MDWYDQIIINEDLKISLLPAVHWSKRSLTDTNKTLWGNFLIEHKNKKILFACDTGYGKVYKELGEKYGPIDLTMINIGAYNFKPMFDKTIYHTTPEEALNVAQDLKSKKVLGMHFGTFVLSLDPIMDPPIIFINVLFPAPFGPSKPNISPCFTSMFKLFNALIFFEDFVE